MELLPKIEDFIEKKGRDSLVYFTSRDPQAYDKLGIEYLPTDIWDGLADFFERRWFGRAWTFQETLLPEKFDLFCGPRQIPWKRLEDLLKVLQLSNWQESRSRAKTPSLDKIEMIPGDNLAATMKLRNLFLKPDPDYQIYLGNIARDSDNEDLTLGYIDHLIYQMRLRSAQDLRDRFSALYGIFSRLCLFAEPKLQNPPIGPDCTKTVAQVYTANIKSLLAHSKSLFTLSQVKDRSYRKLSDLPSWVTDMTAFTTTCLVREGRGNIFNASKGALLQILPASNLETLSLAGYWINAVTATGDNHNRAKPHCEPFGASVALLLKMPKNYITGQDRVEVFWRTLIANLGIDEGVHPAPEALGRSFRKTLMLLHSLRLVGAEHQDDPQNPAAMKPQYEDDPGY